MPILLVRSDGTTARTIPAPRPLVLAPSFTGNFWTGLQREYRLDLKSVTGAQVRTIDRLLPWRESRPAGVDTMVGRTRILGVHEDTSGTLLVLGQQNSLVPPPLTPGTSERDMIALMDSLRRITQSVAYLMTRYTSFVEVLDGATGRVLASQFLPDRYLRNWVGGTDLVSLSEDSDGHIIAEILRVAWQR
jgi:hypothetical protein